MVRARDGGRNGGVPARGCKPDGSTLVWSNMGRRESFQLHEAPTTTGRRTAVAFAVGGSRFGGGA